MKKGWVLFLFALLLCAVAGLWWITRPAVQLARLSGASGDVAGDSLVVIERTIVRDPVRPPAVPPFVVFAGDTIRFDRVDLRERMDRELIAFTYSHSNSLLMLKRSTRIFPQVEPILAANSSCAKWGGSTTWKSP